MQVINDILQEFSKLAILQKNTDQEVILSDLVITFCKQFISKFFLVLSNLS